MASTCPKAQACGGCDLNGVKYSQQLEMKQACVQSLIGRFCPVAPIYAMNDPFRYRNKIQSVFGLSRRGEIVSGIYRKGTHDIIPVRSCMIENRTADEILQSIKVLVKKLGMQIYNEDAHTGFLRHVLIRYSETTSQAMVVLVCSDFRFRQEKVFVREILALHPCIRTILLNKNTDDTSMVLSDLPEKLVYGDGYIEDVLCGLTFRIGPKSFWQVNSVQAQRMFTAAMKMARFTGNETVIDAYCGTGTIGLIAAASGAGSVTGIELNPGAVEDARFNALENNISNASFICGDASDVLKDMARNGCTCDVLFLDPPRAGSTEKFLAAAMRMAPRTIIYISCNPETLARDLRYIHSRGMYRAVGAQPVDMFPQTSHVETVILLNNLKSGQNSHISVDVDMDEYRRIKKG